MRAVLCLATVVLLFSIGHARGDSYTVTLVPGFNPIANQLDNGNNSLSTIFGTNVPNLTQVIKWDATSQGFTLPSTRLPFGWSSNFTLSPGEGAFLRLPAASPLITFQFNGTPHTPVFPLSLTSGPYYFLSRQTNAAGSYEDIVGEAPREGTLLFRWMSGPGDVSNLYQGYVPYVFVNGIWNPEVPVARIGESVFIFRGCGGNCATNPAPLILWNPPSQVVAQGDNASFMVLATGEQPAAYQWFRGTQLLNGATNISYTINNAQPADAGHYTVTITNSHGSVTSRPAMLVVLPPGGAGPVASSVANGTVCLAFNAQAGLTYYIEYKNALEDATWQLLTAVVGNGGAQSYCEAPVQNTNRFYRLRLATGVIDYTYRYSAPTYVNSISNMMNGGCGCTSPESAGAGVACGNAQYNADGSVLLQTGELIQGAVDLELLGRGFPWRFERRYRSGMSYDGPLGHGWDFSDNRRLIVQSNGDVLSMNGLGRADLYVLTNGTFRSPSGFYTRLVRNGDGTFEERHRNGARWSYFAPNALHIAQLSRITDRYSNTMRFEYNAMSQLTNVIDTLGASICYRYDGDGRLSEVRDYMGRTVRFTYDANGDLIEVTSPTVCGAVNGNNFYSGKTTRYSYTSGLADARLNHKLLTTTAANEVAQGGAARLTAVYETNSSSPNIGRVLSVNLGDGAIQYNPMSLGQAGTNDFATPVFQNDVTDRNGNRACYQFNQLGNVVSEVHLTRGLRPGEPAGYTNLFEYNRDGEVTRRVRPGGEAMEYTYDSSNADRFQQGNILAQIRRAGPRGGDQPALTNRMTYETNFNQIATSTDPRGNVTQHFYDASGRRIKTIHAITNIVEDFEYNDSGQMTAHVLADNGSGHRRRDEMTYFTSGPQMGRLQKSIVDAGGLNLTTTYEYDAAGNVVRMIDARGHDTQYIVNELNQVVREISRETTDGSGIRYQSDTYYDANNNVVRMDVQNRDESGVLQTNTAFSTTYEYDSLDNMVRMTQEVSPGTNVVTQYGYDTNKNRSLTRYGEATAGRQTNNIVTAVYDERNRLLRETRGGISTTQHDYDEDGNLIRTLEGIEDPNGVRITTYTYDGYNRRVTTTDPMGNVTRNFYDANGNVTNTTVYGELVDGPGSTDNVRLSETRHTYDAMNRRVQTDVAFFEALSQTPIGDGQATTVTLYTPNSLVFAVIDDNGHGVTNTYDHANRLLTKTDAKGNTTAYTYDANNNAVLTVENELSDLGNPSQSFTNRNIYDNLDRVIATVDNIGNTNQSAYDSRNNQTLLIDGRGNRTHFTYDGLNRLTRTVRDMTSTGDSAGSSVGTITTRQEWDDSSRLIAQIDDNNSATRYAYDGLNRRIVARMADGTLHRAGSGTVIWTNGASFPNLASFTNGYDIHGNAIVAIDANSNIVTAAYDLLNRVTGKIILRGPAVLGSTNETYSYDGLSRLVLAQDDRSRIGRAYDSLGRMIRETNNLAAPGFPLAAAQVVAKGYDGVGNQTSCTYPSGRQVTTTYGPLNRKQAVSDQSGLVATYAYLGPNRVERRAYSNNTWCDYGYDGARRVTSTIHSHAFAGITNIIDSRTFAWDANNNKVRRSDTRLTGPQLTHNYTNDSLDRLIGTLITGLSGSSNRTYRLDGVGNRCNVNTNSTSCTFMVNTVNEYLATPQDSRTYDANGNLIQVIGSSGAGTFAYDYRNLLVAAAPGGGGPAAYGYDVLGRRVQKNVNGTVTRFLYDGGQEVEQQDGAGVALATFVFGNYVDEVLQRVRSNAPAYYHSDDMFSPMALTDAAGSAIERYDYDDYGAPRFYDGAGAPLSQSSQENHYLFTGRRYDPETSYYYLRTRYLDPATGRFISRDRIGTWGDPINLGNAYAYVGNGPVVRLDPNGEVIFIPLLAMGFFAVPAGKAVLVTAGVALTAAVVIYFAAEPANQAYHEIVTTKPTIPLGDQTAAEFKAALTANGFAPVIADRVLDAARAEKNPAPAIGTFADHNFCQQWAQRFNKNPVWQEVPGVDRRVIGWSIPTYGNTIQGFGGHGALRVTLRDGQVFIFDKGIIRGNSLISKPTDVSSNWQEIEVDQE